MGICLILVANTQGFNFIKIGGIWFFRGQKAPIRGLTIIERSWSYGNLPYLVANTQGFNLIKIGGIWFFRGHKPPIKGLTIIGKKLKLCEFALFKGLIHRVSISSKSEVFEFSGGQKTPIRGAYISWKKLKLWKSALFSG